MILSRPSRVFLPDSEGFGEGAVPRQTLFYGQDGSVVPGGGVASVPGVLMKRASDLSIIVFQYPIASGQGYPPDTLLRMCA
jgi:hypothetical protein